jgi:hypothetical protein
MRTAQAIQDLTMLDSPRHNHKLNSRLLHLANLYDNDLNIIFFVLDHSPQGHPIRERAD